MNFPPPPPGMPPQQPPPPEEDFASIEDLQEGGDLREDLAAWFFSATKDAVTELGNTEITVVVGAFQVGGQNLGMRAVLTTDPGHADPDSLVEKTVAFLASTFPGNGFQGQVQIAICPKGKKQPVSDPWGALLSIGQKALPDPNGSIGIGWGQAPQGWSQQMQPPMMQPPMMQPGMMQPVMMQPQWAGMQSPVVQPGMMQQPQMIQPMSIVQGPNGQPMYYWQYQQMMMPQPGMGGGGGRGGPPHTPGMGREDDGQDDGNFNFDPPDDGLGMAQQDWTTAQLAHQQALNAHAHEMRQTELNAGLSEREMTWGMLRWFADRMASQSERSLIMATEALKTARSVTAGRGAGADEDGEPNSRWGKVKQGLEIVAEAGIGKVMDRMGFEDEASSAKTPEIPASPATKQLRAPRKEVPAFQPPPRREIRVERDDVSGEQEYADADAEDD